MVSATALARASRVLLEKYFKIGKAERVLVLDDRKNNRIARALEKTAKELGTTVTIIRLDPGRAHSAPIPEARKALGNCDVCVAPTEKSISHAPETLWARRKKGVRVASMPGITEQMFVQAMKADAGEISETIGKLFKKLKNARQATLETPSGTRLELVVKGREWKWDGVLGRQGKLSNIPFGEIACAPHEDKGGGILVIDSFGKLITPKRPGVVRIERGNIVSWDKEGEKLVELLKKSGGVMSVAELGIGTNPAFKKPVGIVLQDEKILGACHVAFGNSKTMGGKVVAGIHADVILLKPTLTVDGKTIIKNGKIL